MKFMIIFNDRLAKPFVGAALGPFVFSGVALADSHVAMIDDELAAEVQQVIAPLPPGNDGINFGLIDVRAEDGMLVLSGFTGGLEASGKIDRLLRDMDGLGMDKVSNEIVVQ